MKNTCVKCKDTWNVNINSHYVKLDSIDHDNIEKHGQLYSICEDCNNGECESVYK